MELTRIYTGRLRTALTGCMDTTALAQALLALHVPDAAVKAKARGLGPLRARANQAIEGALGNVLPDAWTEGAALGRVSATASAEASEASREGFKAVPVPDWEHWLPGDAKAAARVAGPGLKQLLDRQQVEIKSIAEDRIEALANRLEAYLASQEVHRPPLPEPVPPMYSVDALAADLKGVLDDPSHAELVAQTEIARAASAAAEDTYRELGVDLVQVSTAADDRVCAECLEAEARGPLPVGEIHVPLHPRCRCATISAGFRPKPLPAQTAGADDELWSTVIPDKVRS